MELDLNAEKAPSATFLGGCPITLYATHEESIQQILVRNVETCVLYPGSVCKRRLGTPDKLVMHTKGSTVSWKFKTVLQFRGGWSEFLYHNCNPLREVSQQKEPCNPNSWPQEEGSVPWCEESCSR